MESHGPLRQRESARSPSREGATGHPGPGRARGGPPILVTGSHRSGTTWIGRTIARSRDVFYLSEPFNPHSSRGVCNVDRSRWFLYVDERNEDRFAPAIDRMLQYRYGVAAQLAQTHDIEGLRQVAGEYWSFARARIAGRRPLVKDPIAVLSAPWFASRYGMQIVVSIRHPAAFVQSMRRLDWRFDFENLLSQPLLMSGLMAPFAAEIRASVAHPPDLVESAVLQWRLLHGAIATFEDTHPDWTFVRHEDLSREPIEGFARVFSYLGLEFGDEVRSWLRETTASDNAVEAGPGVVHQLARNSRAVVKSWKKHYSDADLAALRKKVEPLSSRWYGDADW